MLAHELGHVANRDILISSVAAAVATGISFIATMLQFTAFFGGGGDDDDRPNIFVLLATIIVAPIAAGILQMALSRSREFGADRYGARLIGDGEPLARALARLERGAELIPVNVDPAPRAGLHRESPRRAQGQLRQPVPDPPADRGAGPPPRPEGVG